MQAISVPMEPGVKLCETDGELLTDPTEHRRLVGKLIYLTITRLDLSFSVNKLSQYLSAPRTDHLKVAMKVLQYVKKTPGKGIFLPASSEI